MLHNKNEFNLYQYLAAWAVHIFTASAALIGILTIHMIYKGNYVAAIWLMGLAVFIDAADGSLARWVKVKQVLPHIDGTLLDNIVDFLNYVITPCVFLFEKQDMLPSSVELIIIAFITLTSAYQFCQADAKTPDHFFKGFPCYWNIVVFYMFILNSSAQTNAIVLLVLSALIFVPVKYVYPSRLDYLTESALLKVIYHLCSAIYGISSIMILIYYPEPATLWLGISFAYILLYLSLSFYRTYSPMLKAKINASKEAILKR